MPAGNRGQLVEHPIDKAPGQVEIQPDMVKQWDDFGKFVRLNLIGEIVEVVSFDSSNITVKYKGQNRTMEHFEVSRITSEEAAVAAAKRISG